MPATDFFTASACIIVAFGMLAFVVKFLPLPPRYVAVKKTFDFAINLLMPSLLYFTALHVRPNMSTAWFVGYTAVYLGFIFFRSWQAVRVSR
jgi:hypothetical protein